MTLSESYRRGLYKIIPTIDGESLHVLKQEKLAIVILQFIQPEN
jgi:hypothetical protein